MVLRPYEKHVACIFGALFLALTLVSMPKGSRSALERKEILVHVVGAVQECSLKILSGSTVDDVLGQAVLSPKADVLELNGSKKLSSDTILVIPFVNETTLYVVGAVKQPQLLEFSSMPTATEIMQKVQLTESADLARFKRRRVFKTGMVVVIPEKKSRL